MIMGPYLGGVEMITVTDDDEFLNVYVLSEAAENLTLYSLRRVLVDGARRKCLYLGEIT